VAVACSQSVRALQTRNRHVHHQQFTLRGDIIQIVFQVAYILSSKTSFNITKFMNEHRFILKTGSAKASVMKKNVLTLGDGNLKI